MMRSVSALVCLVSFTLYGSGLPFYTSTAKTAPRSVRLLETGEFHGDEVQARDGERWLGLYAVEGRSTLAFSTLIIEPVNDPIVDQDPNTKTGKKVAVRGQHDPVFLIAGADMLRPGPVTTVHAGERPLDNRTNTALTLAGSTYRLTVVSKAPKAVAGLYPGDAKLVLSKGASRQVLYALSAENEIDASWNLLWAGDIDGDRKLDLYVQVSDHYNVSERKLFVSSKAGKNRLLREIAEFRTTGC